MSIIGSTQPVLVPLVSPLPDPPAEGVFSPEQWTTLMAMMDAVVPSIKRGPKARSTRSQQTITDAEYNKLLEHLNKTVVGAPDSNALDVYLAERPSDSPRFQALLKRSLVAFSRDDIRKNLLFVLSALNTRVGALILTGYATPYHQQPLDVRQSILERWRDSILPPLNGLHKQMTVAAKNIWIKTSPTYYQITGYQSVPLDYKPGPAFDYSFLQFPAGNDPEVIETDVVIVGSGCGGAVCAKNLAEAGQRVLVVDKAHYFPPSAFPMTEEAGTAHMFEDGGGAFSDDGSIAITAGSVWGGGGTVNWSAALQPQGFVRKEWAQDRGLTFFETTEFQNCLDRVCDRMGVSADNIRHNHGNNVLLDGARKLGYAAKAVPQNTGGHEHYCGQCTLGCASSEKQGPIVSWLPDAAKAGAKFIEGFKVGRVLFDQVGGQKKAIGVEGTWTSRNSRGNIDGPLSERTVRKVIVKAKKVIVACGTLWSPIVLLNSGLKNRQIGRNLYLHPVNIMSAVFKKDVRPWEGGILTSVVSTFEDLDGHGHGAKLEALCMVPSIAMTLSNVTSGLEFKKLALKYRHVNSFFSLARDRDTGRIYPDPITGVPRIEYTTSAFDAGNIMEGYNALAKILYVEGATEIHAGLPGVEPFIRDPEDGSVAAAGPDDFDAGVTDPRFVAWLKEVQRVGNKPPGAIYASAHQMGSNRMSVREKDGVVDPQGRVWGTKDLYVCDASIFPSASGVNPMITNMAISDWLSRSISKEMASADGKGARL